MTHNLDYYRAMDTDDLTQYVTELDPLTRDPLTQALAERLEDIMCCLASAERRLEDALGIDA